MGSYICALLLLFIPFVFFSQSEVYEKNIWRSLVVKHKISDKYNFTFDVGYRIFDEFIKKRRQYLVRGLFERKIRDNQSVGFGFAYFESISSSLNDYRKEIRPFVQYQYSYKKANSNFSLRFRNELRDFIEDKRIVNRARLQFNFEYKFQKYFAPKLSVEEFLTTPKKIVLEHRYGLSNTFYFSELINFNVFYILQFQSSVKMNNRFIPQNILGLQLNLNIQKK